MHEVYAADAFISQELSPGHLWSSICWQLKHEGLWLRSQRHSMGLQGDVCEWKNIKETAPGESVRGVCVPISFSRQSHTHSHTLTSTHTYVTDMSMGKSPSSDEDSGPCEEFGPGGSVGAWDTPILESRKHVLSPAASILRSGSGLFICIPILHRPGHMVHFNTSSLKERINKPRDKWTLNSNGPLWIRDPGESPSQGPDGSCCLERS